MRITQSILVASVFTVLLSICFSVSKAFSFPGGISGRTKKTTTAGCGNCHNFGTYITATISGPDTLMKGEYGQYSITITKTNSGKGGLNIAALNGNLDITGGENYLKILNGEIVHQSGIVFSGSITINFRYHAPNIVTHDTIFATVNAGYQGRWNFVPEKIIFVKSSSGIENNGSIPAVFELGQNFPNPFNPNTIIKFRLENSGLTTLIVYDLSGKEITKLVNKYLPAGDYSETFDGSEFSSGVYIYKLKSGNFLSQKKMILIK